MTGARDTFPQDRHYEMELNYELERAGMISWALLLCHYGLHAEDGDRIFQRIGRVPLSTPAVPGDVVTHDAKRYEVIFRVFADDGKLEALAVKPCEASW